VYEIVYLIEHEIYFKGIRSRFYWTTSSSPLPVLLDDVVQSAPGFIGNYLPKTSMDMDSERRAVPFRRCLPHEDYAARQEAIVAKEYNGLPQDDKIPHKQMWTDLSLKEKFDYFFLRHARVAHVRA
jgi:hypothetical protein